MKMQSLLSPRVVYRYLLLLFFVVCMLFPLLLSGCARRSEESRNVVLALSGNPSTLDPHATTETLTFQVVKSMFDTLIEPDINGRLVPALAESWQVSEDNLSIHFRLRSGVQFHDGTAFTSRDVVSTFERILSPAFGSPNLPEFQAIERLEAPSPLEVIFHLREPSSPILYGLASGWAAILPADKIAQNHNFAISPIGTGPFIFDLWRQDEAIVLRRNPNYWMEGSPVVEQITFRVLPESSIQLQAMLSGEVDIVYLVDTEAIPVLEASGRVSISQSLSSLVLVIPMNLSLPPMNDPLFRQAVAKSINKQEVLDVAYGGGIPVATFNDGGSPFYVDFSHLFPYDPSAARELLAQSSYRGETIVMSLPQNFPPHVRAGEIYQDMLRRVGIQVELRLVDWATWIGEIYSRANFEMTVIGHTGKLDPHGRFAGYGRGQMYVRWNNEEAADLIDQATRVFSFQERYDIYSKVQEHFARDLPFIYIGSPNRTVASSNRLQGFIMTPVLDTFDFRNVRFQ